MFEYRRKILLIMGTDKKFWRYIFISVFIIFNAQLIIYFYLPALHDLVTKYNLTYAQSHNSFTCMLIGYAIAQFVCGNIATHLSVKRLVLLAFSIIILGTVSILYANHWAHMLLGRFLQGLGAGSLSVLSRILLRKKNSGKSLEKSMAYLFIGMSFAPILSPVISGVIDHKLGFSALSVTILIIALISIIFMFFFLLDNKPKKEPSSFANYIQNYKIILKNKIFLKNISILTLSMSVQFYYLAIMPFVLKAKFNYSSRTVGLCLMLVSLGSLIGNVFFSNISARKTGIFCIKFSQIILFVLAVLMLTSYETFINSYIFIGFVILFAFSLGGTQSFSCAGALEPFSSMVAPATSILGLLSWGGASLLNFIYSMVLGYTMLDLALVCSIVAVLTFLVSTRLRLKLD